MKTFIDIFKTIMLAAALAVSVGSCSDDIDYRGSVVPDGEDAKLTLKVSVTEATHLSRATSDSYVKSLWIGIYNAKSGACTFNQTFEENKEAGNHIPQSLSLDCKSGESYIVAVANYDEFYGKNLKTNVEKPLAEMLGEALTWADYCAIAIEQNMSSGDNDLSVAEPSGELIMSGTYDKADHSGSLPSNIEAVAIQAGTSTLTGAIHLRRLWTENTLNIRADGDIIDMELQNIEVFNVPKYSWIQDRQLADAGIIAEDIAVVNAGDMVDPSPLDNAAYLSSMRFTPPSEIQVSNGVYTFKFWQFENKRTGTATAYEQRETEFKDNGKNTGIFTSLCANQQGDANNNATYVKINATITYRNPGSMVNPDDVQTGDNAGQLPGSAASRTAEVTYIVHLGYIGNEPTDFNCYRNSKYTYNITAESVNKILVEAFNGDEKQPGAEGTVTDVTDKIENLDAHTGVFNIFLTTEQVSSFTFSMRTYAKGEPKSFYYNSATDSSIPAATDADFKYYNWIEFVPTGLDLGRSDRDKTAANERVFAAYPNIVNGRTGVYYPHELPTSGLQGQWFTVYVNEYTYEKRYGETGYGNETGVDWKEYVNQPNRQAWFNVAQEISPDGHSVYFKSKYALTQRSIQTYYNTADDGCETALGIEHINESFGMNIRWSGDVGPSGDNGRYNGWYVLGNDYNWETYVQSDTQQQINAITNTKQTANASFSTEARTYAVPMHILMTDFSGSGTGHYNSAASADYDPQTGDNAQYINAAIACLNRNRDENGNGQIDEEELKWYLPGAGKYLRIILGRNSLQTPLMDYQQVNLADKCGNDANTLYHFVSSEGKIIWADEGLSSSNFISTGNWSHAPWQLRCIRNLGTDLREISDKGDGVTPAYDDTDYDSSTFGGIVKVSHYYGTALREPTTTPLPMHKTSAPENKLGRYGFEIAPCGNMRFDMQVDGYDCEAPAQFFKLNGNNITVTKAYGTSESGLSIATYEEYCDSVAIASPCSQLNESSGRKGWRIPNQKEAAIMMRMGVLRGKARWATVTTTWWQTTLNLENSTDTNDGIMTCTQEHWDKNKGSSSQSLSWNYRIVTVDANNKIGIATDNNAKTIHGVRCVRDLTAAEANKTYEQIVNNR